MEGCQSIFVTFNYSCAAHCAHELRSMIAKAISQPLALDSARGQGCGLGILPLGRRKMDFWRHARLLVPTILVFYFVIKMVQFSNKLNKGEVGTLFRKINQVIVEGSIVCHLL